MKEVKCLEVRSLCVCLFVCCCFLLFSTPFKNSSQGPAASTGICSFASYKRKEKTKYMLCVEFFMASWRSLDRFLTPLDFSRRLLACSWLVSVFPRIGKSTQESSRSKQEDIKKLLKRRQEAPRHVKTVTKCQKEEEVSIIFLKISKKNVLVLPDRSRILKKC